MLLIDDPVSDLRLLMDMMNLKDLRSHVALSGERGDQQAILRKPSLVWLAVGTPGMKGIATCRQIKAHPVLPFMPVGFLTTANDLAESEPDASLNVQSATAIVTGHDRPTLQPQGAVQVWR